MAARRRFGRLALATVTAVNLLSGCLPYFPAKAPPQIHHTPGAYIVVLEGQVDTADFRLSYPASWRLIKQSAAAERALRLVLLSPDGGSVTLLQSEHVDELEEIVIALSNGEYLYVQVEPAAEADPAFRAQVDHILDSINS